MMSNETVVDRARSKERLLHWLPAGLWLTAGACLLADADFRYLGGSLLLVGVAEGMQGIRSFSNAQPVLSVLQMGALCVGLGLLAGATTMILLWCFLGVLAVALIGDGVRMRIRLSRLKRSGVYPATGQATMVDVQRLKAAGHEILAMRCYREIHGCGLREAKEAVDSLPVTPSS